MPKPHHAAPSAFPTTPRPATPAAAPAPTPALPPPLLPWDTAGASDDIVQDILRRVMQLTPGFSAALAAQVDRQVREHWGRDRVYIARRAGEGSSTRNDQIRRDARNGERIGLLCRRYQLSRQRIHQILTQPAD